MLYLDTSAFLKLYVLESGSERVQEMVASQFEPLPIWEIQEMEFHNALMLKAFRKEMSKSAVEYQLSQFTQRKDKGLYYSPEIRRAQLLEDFRRLSWETLKLGCRSMDILHVACACQLGADQFISFDDRQKKLAIKAGLNVPDLSA